MSGLLHEPSEFGDRHRVAIHPESIDTHPVDWPLLRIEVLRAHEEAPARAPTHPLRLLRRRPSLILGYLADQRPTMTTRTAIRTYTSPIGALLAVVSLALSACGSGEEAASGTTSAAEGTIITTLPTM